jgi:hypothetical protein
MKTIAILIAVSTFSFNAAGLHLKEYPEKYCAKMKDGKKVVVHQGETITTEVVLKNGTKIKPDGTVTMNDGSSITLKDGECMDKDGAMMKEKKKSK